VTFSAPASGPSGTFGGPGTLVADSDGIAIAPILTANGTPGTFTVLATVAGTATSAAFVLTNLPRSSSITIKTNQVNFSSTTGQPAPPAQPAKLAIREDR
jgi:hypothetical protein